MLVPQLAASQGGDWSKVVKGERGRAEMVTSAVVDQNEIGDGEGRLSREKSVICRMQFCFLGTEADGGCNEGRSQPGSGERAPVRSCKVTTIARLIEVVEVEIPYHCVQQHHRDAPSNRAYIALREGMAVRGPREDRMRIPDMQNCVCFADFVQLRVHDAASLLCKAL
ncbi:hypothetical protein LIA77_09281 [Sarocladium implicatum]|nr:hypothetical protein LIA77_09281 [Sarocladium implicatum]